MTKLGALRRIAEGLGELADFEALERQRQHQEIDQRYLHLLLDELGEDGRFTIEERRRPETASAHFAGTGGIKARPRVWSREFRETLWDLVVVKALSRDNAYQVMRKLFPGIARDADVWPASEQFPLQKRGRKPKQR